jgi:hypothetical protein
MGWFTGGGHGFLSSIYGLGSDNLLEAVLVTPTGSILTVNACQHPDLFFAVRGGGGGTHGVVISAVMRAYDEPVTTLHSLELTSTSPNVTKEFWDLMAFMHSQMPALKDGGMQGYYFIVGPPLAPTLSFIWAFTLYNKPTGTAETLFEPIKTYLDEHAALFVYKANTTTFPSFFDFFVQVENEQVATGGSAYGSRLLPRRALTSDLGAVARTLEAIGPSADQHKPSVHHVTVSHKWTDKLTHTHRARSPTPFSSGTWSRRTLIPPHCSPTPASTPLGATQWCTLLW